MLSAGFLLRSAAWSIREAGPEIRKWRKPKQARKAISR